MLNALYLPGMGDRHNGVNFMRAACVIAMEKAQLSFEPMLESLRGRTAHIMKRLSPVIEDMISKSATTAAASASSSSGGGGGLSASQAAGAALSLGAHSAPFQQLVRAIFEKFVDEQVDACIARCRDDLVGMTRFVTWDVEDKGGASALYRLLPTPKKMVEIYTVAQKRQRAQRLHPRGGGVSGVSGVSGGAGATRGGRASAASVSRSLGDVDFDVDADAEDDELDVDESEVGDEEEEEEVSFDSRGKSDEREREGEEVFRLGGRGGGRRGGGASTVRVLRSTVQKVVAEWNKANSNDASAGADGSSRTKALKGGSSRFARSSRGATGATSSLAVKKSKKSVGDEEDAEVRHLGHCACACACFDIVPFYYLCCMDLSCLYDCVILFSNFI
jgi:hypothetical protein